VVVAVADGVDAMIPAVVGWFASWLGVSDPSTLATAEAIVLGGAVLWSLYVIIALVVMVFSIATGDR
jgi:hypothetical protein